MKTEEHKSRMVKDLERAVFLCQLRDDLAELMDNAAIQDKRIRVLINRSFEKATVLLARAIAANSKYLQGAQGR